MRTANEVGSDGLATAMQDQGWIEVCEASEVSQDVPAKAQIAGESVAVFQVRDRYYITQNLCTHGPGELADGYVDGDEVECPFHQGRFSIRTGEPTSPPCTVALRTWEARLLEGLIYASAQAGQGV